MPALGSGTAEKLRSANSCCAALVRGSYRAVRGRVGLRAPAPGLIYKPPESPLQPLKTSKPREGAARLQKEGKFSGFALQTFPPSPPPAEPGTSQVSLRGARFRGRGNSVISILFIYLFPPVPCLSSLSGPWGRCTHEVPSALSQEAVRKAAAAPSPGTPG